jgi:hypothetical protein
VNAAVLASSAFLRDSLAAWGTQESLEPQMNADERRCCGAVLSGNEALKEFCAGFARAMTFFF